MPSLRPVIALAAVAATAASAAASTASGTPTLDVRVTDDAVEIARHAPLGPGPVTLALRRDSDGDARTVAVVELAPGRTPRDLAAIPLRGLADASRVAAVGRLVGGTTVARGAGVKITIPARSRRYVVVDVTDEANPSDDFAVAGDRRSHRRRADATIVLLDDAIRLPSALPRDGAIRVRNEGRRPHHALAIRLEPRLGVADALRKLRSGAAPERLGDPVDLMGLLSPGVMADVERPLAPGRYVVVSFHAGSGARAKPDILRGVAGSTRVR